MSKKSVIASGTIIIILAFSAFVRGQMTTATISGVLTDETGAVLPGAQITVMNVETGLQRVSESDRSGRFLVMQLQPGAYQVTATMTGFETLIRKGITLAIGQDASLNLSMKVGAITQTVEVTGEAPLIDTTSSAVSGVVEEKRISELPLNGRDFSQLALVQTGVFLVRNTDTRSSAKGFGARISMAGSRVDQTAWLLDGVNIRDKISNFGIPGSASGLVLGVDAVREFQVLISNYSAEFGGTTGGVVNMVTKSGTNSLHGSVYEFIRNDNLDARNFFDRNPANPLKRSNPPEFKRNQFGFSLGGPLKKDKAFIFGNYEGLRERLGVTDIAVVPDELVHRGLIPASGGSREQVQVAPHIRPFLDMWPLPNGPAVGTNSGTAQLLSPSSPSINEHYFVVRADYSLTPNQSLFGRFTFDQGDKTIPDTVPLTASHQLTRTRNVTLQYDRIFTPRFLATTRLAYNRALLGSSAFTTVDFPPEVFIPWSLGKNKLPPSFGFTGVTGIGVNSQNLFGNLQNVYQVSESLVLTRGGHAFKFGVDFEKGGFNLDGGDRGNGSFGWASMRAFLEDRPLQSFGLTLGGSSVHRSLRQNFLGLYFQDDWKMRTNLSVNFGVRYEPFSTPTEKWGRLSHVKDWVTATRFDTDEPYWNNPSDMNFSPRVGFAWDPQGDGRTAVRGGFGLFFMQIVPAYYRVAANRSAPFYGIITDPLPGGNLASAVADVDRVAPAILSTFQMSPITFFQLPTYNPDPTYEMKFNLTVVRELPGGISVTAGYIGARGMHLWRLGSANAALPTVVNGRSFVAAGTPRLNPNTGPGALNYTDAQTFYNGLQVELKKRLSRGFQYQVSYTWSKNVDDSTTGIVATDYGEGDTSQPYNPKADRGLSGLNVSQNIVVNGIYSFPSPSGSGIVSHLLGGWQLSSIFQAASGDPFSPGISGSVAPDLARSNSRQRPDLLPGRSFESIILGGPDKYFDPSAFVLAPPGFYGNAGRNILRSPGLVNIDFSLMKGIPMGISEESRMEFRADVFNVFNRANFAAPASTVLNATTRLPIATAGLITRTSAKSRQLQFGLKLIF